MTALSSTGNFSKFGTYFLYKLRTLRTLIVMNSIFALLSYPLAFGLGRYVVHIANQMEQVPLEDPKFPALQEQLVTLEGPFIGSVVVGVIMLICMFVMSYIIPAKSMRWLYKKSVVDMDYSLPVSDDTRFFGDLLAGLAGSLVPHLAAVAIGLIIFKTINISEIWGSAAREGLEMFDQILPQLMFTGVFSCVMFTAISLFVMSVCGRSAEARIYPFVINAVIPVLHYVCIAIVVSNMFGYTSRTDNTLFNSAASTSPIGMLIETLRYSVGVSTAEEFRAPISRPGLIIPAVIITIACFVGAYFLIKIRRAERVGSPYVFKGVSYVIPALVTFAVVAPFAAVTLPMIFDVEENSYYSYTPHPEGYLFTMVILTFVLYVIMELISGRGFKKFYITIGKYALTMVASWLICMGLYFSNGMGMANIIPQAESVAATEVQMWYYDEEYNDNFYVDLMETENIRIVTDIHREILEKGRIDTRPDNYPQMIREASIDVRYTLKDGTTVYRRYDINDEMYFDYVERLILPEGYYNRFDDAMEALGTTILSVDKQDGNGDIRVNIPSEEFKEAFRKDCDSVSYDLLYGEPSHAHYYSVELKTDHRYTNYLSSDAAVGGHSVYFSVLPWYQNTIALLEKYGVTGFTTIELSDFQTAVLIRRDRTYWTSNSILAAFLKSGDTSLTPEEYFKTGFFISDDIDEMQKETLGVGAVILPEGDELERLFEHSSGKDVTFHKDVSYILVMMLPYTDFKGYVNSGMLDGDAGYKIFYVRQEDFDTAEKLLNKYNVITEYSR